MVVVVGKVCREAVVEVPTPGDAARVALVVGKVEVRAKEQAEKAKFRGEVL